MAPVPVARTPPAELAEIVEKHFRCLAAVWASETAHLSSATRIVNHPAVRQIAAMGPAVVPFMLRDLARTPGPWVWALSEITGADPVTVPDRGDIAKMTEA